MGQALDVVTRFYERFNAGDMDGAEELFNLTVRDAATLVTERFLNVSALPTHREPAGRVDGQGVHHGYTGRHCRAGAGSFARAARSNRPPQ